MAKEARLEVAWASFLGKVRLDSQSSEIPALASTAQTKLFMDDIRGVTHLVIEDPSLPKPAAIPWTNIASVGWMK